MLHLPLLALTLLAPPSPAAPVADTMPRDGVAVLQRMHQRYEGKWYRTLTFVQTTSITGRPDETWYEAGAIPGRLRIDVAPLESRNAFMFVGDSVFVFRNGERVGAAAERNLLLTLGFDVYGQAPDTTAAQLRAAGIDLSIVRADTLDGRAVWVVGAAAGDTTSPQFWIEQERLLFVRLIEQQRNPNQPDAPPAIMDIEFRNYEPLGGGWIAPEVVIKRNGEVMMREVYRDMRADVELPPDLYDTTTYRAPAWAAEP